MASTFRTGQRFRFPDEDVVYIFLSIGFDAAGDPVVAYLDEHDQERTAVGYYLSDLTRA